MPAVRRFPVRLPAILAVVALGLGTPLLAQGPPREDRPEVPPPARPNPNPEVSPPPPGEPLSKTPTRPAPDELMFDLEGPWGLPSDLLARLGKRAEDYRAFAKRVTCDETARVASYDGQGEASKESLRRFAYFLERDAEGTNVRETRSRLDAEGRPKGDEIEDEGKFPPAYAWVFLFSSFNQPYFAYRDLGDRFEGFHWVRVLQFRGALPFTDGKDVREWEGLALFDAVSLTPVQILARPSSQRERIQAMFDRWSQAFNVIGIHLAPRPFGYRGRVEFRLLREGLTFPTELRYDTFRAVGRRETVPIAAAVRTYDDCKFFSTGATEEIQPPSPGD
jgi:hypothetical protein